MLPRFGRVEALEQRERPGSEAARNNIISPTASAFRDIAWVRLNLTCDERASPLHKAYRRGGRGEVGRGRGGRSHEGIEARAQDVCDGCGNKAVCLCEKGPPSPLLRACAPTHLQVGWEAMMAAPSIAGLSQMQTFLEAYATMQEHIARALQTFARSFEPPTEPHKSAACPPPLRSPSPPLPPSPPPPLPFPSP